MDRTIATRMVDRIPGDLVHHAVRAMLPKERKSLGAIVSELRAADASSPQHLAVELRRVRVRKG